MSIEIEKLKAFNVEHKKSLHNLKQENQNLQANLDASINMNIETEAIKRECVEKNKGFRDQVAVLNRELELIKGLSTDRFPVSILPLTTLVLLNGQAGGRKSTKIRCRK